MRPLNFTVRVHRVFIFPVLLAVAISVIYFRNSPRTEPLARRLLASAHGVVIAVLFISAIAIWLSGHSQERLGTPFQLLLLIPLALMIASFFLFKGPKATHLLQILDVVCLLWTWFVGGMAVTGDWL